MRIVNHVTALALLVIIAGVARPGFGATPIGWCGDSVRLHESYRVQAGQSRVLLSQVADLHGPLAEELGDLVVCTLDRAPGAPGHMTRRLRVDDVRDAIGRSGANLGLLAVSGSVCLVRPPLEKKVEEDETEHAPVEVDPHAGMAPAGRFYDEPTLRSLVARSIAQVQFAGTTGTIMLRFRDEDAQALNLPATGREYEIVPAVTPNTGRVPLDITVFNGPHAERVLHLVVDVAIERDVIVARRNVSGGRTIGPDDVTVERRVIDPSPIDPIDALESVVGKDAHGRLIRGQVVRAGDVDEPIAHKRGDKVTIRARSGAFILRMPGMLLEEARPGQFVKVRRLTDRVELVGRLEPDGEINVSATRGAQAEDQR